MAIQTQTNDDHFDYGTTYPDQPAAAAEILPDPGGELREIKHRFFIRFYFLIAILSYLVFFMH
jgi:hypothetical protein